MNTGYKHRFEKSTGGIRDVILTPVSNIREAAFDPRTGQYVSIRVKEPAEVYSYTFAEGAAGYRETGEFPFGVPCITHLLEFYTDKIDGDSDRLIRRLAEFSACGMVAVVTTNNHIRLVVGYSEEHRNERPLRLRGIASDSGKKPTDSGHEAVSLLSIDTAKARILSGHIG